MLSVDEESQIQALNRTQPGLPLKPGKAGTMTHDYLRNGVTTLFAAFGVLDGTVLGRCMQRHRLADDPRFRTNGDRLGHRTEPRSSCASSTRSRPRCRPAK